MVTAAGIRVTAKFITDVVQSAAGSGKTPLEREAIEQAKRYLNHSYITTNKDDDVYRDDIETIIESQFYAFYDCWLACHGIPYDGK